MIEIVKRELGRKKKIRYAWHCTDCGQGAGAWPEQKTAVDSGNNHAQNTAWCAKLGKEREKRAAKSLPTIQVS